MRDLYTLPKDLPIPHDDGACARLEGTQLPNLALPATNGREVNLRSPEARVFFFYPRTGEPGKPALPDWDLIPGARGCTPQSCGFRDLHADFAALGCQVFGVSTQTTDYQQEFVARNHIPFALLSDHRFKLTEALGLPTFNYLGQRLIKRLAFVAREGVITKVFYPVFPPNENAADVLKWLSSQKQR